MEKVKIDSHTTLLLDSHWLPLKTISAEKAIHSLYKGSIQPIGIGKEIISSEDWIEMASSDDGLIEEHINVNNPYICSAHKKWPLPTVAVVSSHYINNKKKAKNKVTMRRFARVYDNRCQICLKHFSYRELTREHVRPKAKHGTDDIFNMLPTCFPCNNKKSDKYPYFDAKGVNLEDKIKPAIFFFVDFDLDNVREEWKPFLFRK